MNRDPFSYCHPAVNFIFFLGTICLGVAIQHPVYILVSLICGITYYLLIHGPGGLKLILGLLPWFMIMTLINPLFNTQGETLLFFLFGRPYTLEALWYGADLSAIFMAMTVWFGCCHAVLTGDKLTALFGNLAPSLSLLVVMVLRMIPNLIRKGRQITGARKSIGKGSNEQSSYMEKVNDAMTILSTLTSWSLEGGVVTGDSMRSRGYGCGKRTSFQLSLLTNRDCLLILAMIPMLIMVFAALMCGHTAAVFTPRPEITPIRGFGFSSLITYGAYLLIPTVLHIKEAIRWHISRSKI
jgi:energy-coupling factor transport system permease protein